MLAYVQLKEITNMLTVKDIQNKYGISRSTLYHLTITGFLSVTKEIRNGRAVNFYKEEEIKKLQHKE